VKKYLQYTPEELIGKSSAVIMDSKTVLCHFGTTGYLTNFKRKVQPGHQTAIGTSQYFLLHLSLLLCTLLTLFAQTNSRQKERWHNAPHHIARR
jgi:hypothetical protein